MAKIDDKIRSTYMGKVKSFLEELGEEVLLVKSGTYSLPWVDGEEQGYLNITFSIPKGERGGNGYDGHEESQNFIREQEIKKEEKEKKEIAKQKKIARDKKVREKKKEEEEKKKKEEEKKEE